MGKHAVSQDCAEDFILMEIKNYRLGLIVPSSNVTMETELPKMFRDRFSQISSEHFTFHSARMRMKHVTEEALRAMDQDSLRCAAELADAKVDAVAYACLVAIMAMGKGYHRASQKNLTQRMVDHDTMAPVLTSAGALIDTLKFLRAKKISMIAPYAKPLTEKVIDYLAEEGIDTVDSLSRNVTDNDAVGRLNPLDLLELAQKVKLNNADVLVLSACVQMPSLPAIALVEKRIGIPVISAATATVFQLLKGLGLACYIPNAGSLLEGS